eukprot:9475872-Pyramimonas_sp.AAC.2
MFGWLVSSGGNGAGAGRGRHGPVPGQGGDEGDVVRRAGVRLRARGRVHRLRGPLQALRPPQREARAHLRPGQQARPGGGATERGPPSA